MKHYLHVFKAIQIIKISEKIYQIIPTSINDAFRIEKADINKDGTLDYTDLKDRFITIQWMPCKMQN